MQFNSGTDTTWLTDDWMSPDLNNKGESVTSSPLKPQASQYQGLGDMMGKGIETGNNYMGKFGGMMTGKNMPGILSNLGQMILAGGRVQGMPVNAIANAANKMAEQKQRADFLNKLLTIPNAQGQQTQQTPQSVASPLRPVAPPQPQLVAPSQSKLKKLTDDYGYPISNLWRGGK